jgi:GNAT superfamily N-acetyltransferase
VRIRPAQAADLLSLARIFVRAADELDRRQRVGGAGPSSRPPETRLPMYRHLLATGAMFVAEESQPVGFSAAIVRDGVWFLSQLWVLPEHQGRGIGGALLDEALAWGRGASAFTVVASAHPAAMTLYLRASMFPMWVQYELTGGERGDGPRADVRPLTEADGAWVDDLDRDVRGLARPEDHRLFRAQAEGLVLAGSDRPLGYVYVWDDGKVGPGAVLDPADAPDLLRAARMAARVPIAAAVPSTNWSALRAAVAEGLVPVTTSTFMASRPLGDGTRYLSSGGALG